ncbi:RraA family protein [Acinetobacter pittii]|uniref:RraA family protein n=1 Tax=Acinetobacter pittii TaxID=48296 RepID=UPI0021D15A17|nr:RraA family protein [Acinetobacter pittii]MCU4528182.1 RraA family protein [Acinetobacter pittii]
MNEESFFSNFHTPTIADVLDSMGIWGVLDPSIIPVNKLNSPFYGRAITVKWAPVRKPASIVELQNSTWNNVKDFLLPKISDGSGLVYVAGVDNGLLPTLALAGGFSASHFERIGFKGMILGGAIRDAHVIEKIKIPIFATNFTPADTQGNYRVSEVGTSCNVGHVTINTGDYIFADKSGCVVVPAAVINQVIIAVNETENRELDIQSRIEAGDSLYTIVAELGRL